MDSERVCYSGGQRLDDAGCVEDHGDGDGENDELHESRDLTGEEEKECYDTHYPEE